MAACLAHRQSPREDCPRCVAHVDDMDHSARLIEDHRDFAVAQLVSVAEAVGVSLTRADAQHFLDLADQDADQAFGLALACDFTVVPSFPGHDSSPCGPAPAPVQQPIDKFTVDGLDDFVVGHHIAGSEAAALEPVASQIDTQERVGSDEQAADGPGSEMSARGPSTIDEFRIGQAPFHHVEIALMNPGNAGQITGQLSTQVPLSELVSAVCGVLGVPTSDAQILQDGKELSHNSTLAAAGAHLPLKNTGTVFVKLFLNNPVELHPCKGVATKTDSWEDAFHINGKWARMCGSCGSGPYINEACSNLATHRRGGVNSCKTCGWYTAKWEDWPLWDGGRRRRS